MLESGFICPSYSPWTSPVIMVHKKDGKLHFCVDFRQLNAATVKDVHPLPRIDELLDAFHGTCWFSFSRLNWETCLFSLDDIIVFLNTWEERLECLECVFQRLREAKIKLGASKCSLAAPKIMLSQAPCDEGRICYPILCY